MRKIDKIIWHCSATPAGMDVKGATIKVWHTKDRGWSDIGYHYVIELDGTIYQGRPLERPGAHTRGHNDDSIGICYVGGGVTDPSDTRTPEQKRALYALTDDLIRRFPGATVHGHREFASKACPSFDAQKDWSEHKSRKEAATTAPCPHCGKPLEISKP